MGRWFLVAMLAVLAVLGPVRHAPAEGAPDIFSSFDARVLSAAEKRLLQTALAATGDYDGLLDGAWGPISQQGIAAYAAREFPGGVRPGPLNLHAAALVIAFVDEIARNGWEFAYLPDLGVALALPLALLDAEDIPDAQGWRERDGGLSVVALRQDAARAATLHSTAAAAPGPAEGRRTLRRHDRMITAGVAADGRHGYLRSDYVAGGWSTVRIVGHPDRARLIGLIGASIDPRRAEPWDLPAGGTLARLVRDTFDLLADAAPATESTLVAAPPPRTTPGADAEISTGTGFYLGARLLVTAAHVIGGCATVALADGTPLTVVAADADLDVAALRAPVPAPAWLRLGADAEARLGQRVNALGYPYFGLSGTSLNVTGGNISALAGMDDDRRFVSITAPVQPGNSGGPLLDGAGAVAGMVVARLSESYIADTTGSMPQNVNFALSSAELADFLRGNGLRPEDDGLPAFAMDNGAPPEISGAVVPIVCY